MRYGCHNRRENLTGWRVCLNFKDITNQPPRQGDVAIVGSGYTGLNAALQTIRGGRSTVVFESGVPGQGCVRKMEDKSALV